MALLTVLGGGTVTAQSVLDQLEGNYNVLTTATNARGTVFYELDITPPNLEAAIDAGVGYEANQRVVVITPSIVRWASVVAGHMYGYEADWLGFVSRNSFDFSLTSAVIDGTGGLFLTPDSISRARSGLMPEGVTPVAIERQEEAAVSEPAVAHYVNAGVAAPVIDRLDVDVHVLNRAVNEYGTVFVEVDAEADNTREAVLVGVLEMGVERFVLFTPRQAHYVSNVDGEVVYARSAWNVFTRNNASNEFSTRFLDRAGSGGSKLAPTLNSLTLDDVGKTAPTVRRQSSSGFTRSTPPLATHSCSSSTTAAGSTMTCRSGGQITYQSRCTVNARTFAVTCTGSYY